MSRATVSVLKCMEKLLVTLGTLSGKGGAGLSAYYCPAWSLTRGLVQHMPGDKIIFE